MMKALIGIVILFSALILAGPFNASKAVAPNAETKIEKRQEFRQEVKTRIEEKKATREAKLTLLRQTRIRSFWTRMKGRLLAFAARVEILIERIESRIATVKSEDPEANLIETENKLSQAKELLAETTTMISDADSLLEELLVSEDPKVAFQSFKDEIKKIKTSLSGIHRLLVSVIGDIKGLRVGQKTESVTGNSEE